jgi:hypothetical protein
MHISKYLEENNINSPYLKYAKSIYSQGGDDGILEKLLSELNVDEGVIVEFGALDGITISGTYNIWRNNNKFKVLLIEPDPNAGLELLSMFGSRSNIEFMNCFVSPNKEDENSLDSLMDKSKFDINNKNLAIVLIDVDSFDYYIFDSIEKYKPFIFIIETNSNFFPEIEHNENLYHGASLRSLNDLAKKKGYSLVVSTGNAFFVRDDLLDKLNEYNSNLTLSDYYINNDNVEKITQAVDENGNLLNYIRWTSKEYKDFIAKEKNFLLGIKE